MSTKQSTDRAIGPVQVSALSSGSKLGGKYFFVEDDDVELKPTLLHRAPASHTIVSSTIPAAANIDDSKEVKDGTDRKLFKMIKSKSQFLLDGKPRFSSTLDLAQITTLPKEVLTMGKFLFPPYRIFDFSVGLNLAVSTDASGNISSSTGFNPQVTGITSAAEWSSLAALFDEIFIDQVEFNWMPHVPWAFDAGSVAVRPPTMGCTVLSLYSGASPFTSMAASLSCSTAQVHHLGKPFRYTYHNVERMDPRGPCNSYSGTAIPTQGWCSTNSTSMTSLQGAIQMIAATSVTTTFYSLEFGRFATRYHAYFRNRG